MYVVSNKFMCASCGSLSCVCLERRQCRRGEDEEVADANGRVSMDVVVEEQNLISWIPVFA